ncbi:response regulator [Vibrio sp. S4M6]|uniref:response regulator n=1 Tax=Vibrio sinus TaxID=2946865 RepID=UPI00202A7CA1|nr:response regulator [Vibrio sinus]
MKVLIVDDSKATLEIVRRALEKYSYRRLYIKKAATAVEALSVIGSWQPQIVLTDWHMPDMSGLMLVQEIDKRKMGIKIGMITTVDDEDEIDKAEKAGASFVLSKPFEDADLHKKIKPLVRSIEEEEIVPATNASKDDWALPRLPQLEKNLQRAINPNVRISPIKKQLFDESKVPCLMAVFEDSVLKKPKVVALLDVYAICVFSKRNTSITDEQLQLAIHKSNVCKEMVDTCQDVLDKSAITFVDKHTRRSLKLKNVSFIPENFNKLEVMFAKDGDKRLDFACQIDMLAQGKVTLVAF